MWNVWGHSAFSSLFSLKIILFMAQKSNPISLRLRKTNKLWNSCWYGDYNYTKQLLQDRGVSAYIQNICQQAKMAPPVVFLNRQRQQTSTFFFFSRHQRVSRIKRPSRGEFRKSARAGVRSTWLHKLLFWSCAVGLDDTNAVNGNAALELPLRASKPGAQPNKTGVSRLHPAPPTRGYFSGELFGLFPYLLVSQAATHNCQDYAKKRSREIIPSLEAGKDKPQAKSTFHLSPPQGGRSGSFGETTGGSESPCYPLNLILSTLKKNSDQNNTRLDSNQASITPTRRAGLRPPLAFAPATGIPFHLLETCQQDWGFFAMRNQYFASAKITASASFPGRLSQPPFPGRVQQRSMGGSVNPGRNAVSPWRNHLESCISAQTHHNSTLHFLLCPSVHQNPFFLATQLCFSLENRKTFRRLKDRLMQDISADSSIKGVRITCSGRVAARSKKAQKAKTESIQWGQTSLNVFSDLVNFASKSALTPFGKIGVKVWICYREINQPE